MNNFVAPMNHSYIFNKALAILGIFALGVFINWFPLVFVRIPWPQDEIIRPVTDALWQTVTTIFIPVTWAIWRLGLKPADMGLTLNNLGKTTLLGCALYTLALVSFIHCSDDPLIAKNLLRNVDTVDAIILTSSMSLVAAGTDIATRGFILLTLARYTNVWFAIVVQNLTWYLGHIHEIGLLENCLGYYQALGLTLTLGLLGDAIALRTRNVIGLSIAHILLNVVMVSYMRHL